MKKLCVFTLYDTDGASSYYRSYIFKEKYQERYTVKYYNFWDNKYINKYIMDKKKHFFILVFKYIFNSIKRIYQIIQSRDADIIIFQKAIIPKSKLNLISFLKKRDVRIIFEVDDAIYLDKFDNSHKIAELADSVVVGNEILKEYYSKYNSKVHILPTVEHTPTFEKHHKDTFNNHCIGWIGSHTSIENLELLVNPINQLVKKYPEIKFKFICNEPYGFDKKINNSTFVKWNKDTYLKEMEEFTIGVMPLYINEFNEGKNGFKLIQYLNLKKPVVATDVGVNKSIVEKNGLVCIKQDEWTNNLEKILINKEFYMECVENIETHFFDKYHYNVIGNQWLNILESIY